MKPNELNTAECMNYSGNVNAGFQGGLPVKYLYFHFLNYNKK